MIPDLGKYAGAVLGAYGASVALLVVLVAVSLWQAGRMKRRLAEVEARMKGSADV
ncbi:MAG: heme exporter protein CcmD [Paracoccaceae bacterium]